MKELNSIQEIESLINNSDMALLYFTGSKCGACEVIRDKVDKLLDEYPKIKSGVMNAEDHPETTGIYNILTVPQFFVYIYGKETIREGRNFDFRELREKLNRYYEMVFNTSE
ncbi:MAG: thioredoxin protein [Anaerocolumna sp.]|jgi:thiol-disulfide isomerase/thioredoxin|nr:thioredoxin protein [Anaerocolumna sp.]